MRRCRRFGICSLVGLALVALVTVAAPLASAATPSVAACAAKSQEHVVVIYRRGPLAMPLRCGSPTWGFRHIVGHGRWNERFDASTALTFARGQEYDNGSRYALFDADCLERFRVVVNPRAFRGVEFRPQGIVTAYETNWPNSVSWTGGDAAPRFRTDCPLFDEVRLRA